MRSRSGISSSCRENLRIALMKMQSYKKRKLGYIPEKDNIVFARLMDAGKYLIAKIDRIEPKGSFRQINISIYLVDF